MLLLLTLFFAIIKTFKPNIEQFRFKAQKAMGARPKIGDCYCYGQIEDTDIIVIHPPQIIDHSFCCTVSITCSHKCEGLDRIFRSVIEPLDILNIRR